jgi:choline dehydrogenase-like flavoprotein
LNSKNKKYENGLANGSGQVGKNLMLHPLGYVEGLFKENLESDFGPQGCCFASHEFCRSGNLNPSEGGFSMQVLRGPGIAESASRWFKRGKLPINSDFAKRLLDRYNHTAHIAIIVEDFPEEHNSVSLIENSYETRLRVNYEISQLSRQRLKRGLRVASEVMRESGAHDVIQFAPIQESGWHIMGTCKMGHSADDSVVNSIGETHEVQNLFIADASIFASSSTLNPSATIHALGLMIATQILRRFS